MKVLATPLSAGSKTEPLLLHLKVSLGRLLFFVHLTKNTVEHAVPGKSSIDKNEFVALE